MRLGFHIDTIIFNGRKFKSYRGMGSLEAMEQKNGSKGSIPQTTHYAVLILDMVLKRITTLLRYSLPITL